MTAFLSALAPWIADVFVVLGLVVITIGVYGIVWLPDVYNKLHAASKVVVLGLISFLVAAAVATGDPKVVFRAILIGAFLLITTPVSAHAIGRAAYLREQRMRTPGAVDESGHGLADRPPTPDKDA